MSGRTVRFSLACTLALAMAGTVAVSARQARDKAAIAVPDGTDEARDAEGLHGLRVGGDPKSASALRHAMRSARAGGISASQARDHAACSTM